MIKNLLRVLLLSVVLLALAFVGLIFLVNPNQYRGAIEQAVFDSTGYELNIAGDLDLMFSPYIGLTLQDVRLRNPALPQELASTTEIVLRVDPGLLLQGELLISELRADDLHINFFTDAASNNNWSVQAVADTPIDAASTATVPAPAVAPARGTTSSNNIRASFERLLVNNASIDIQDLAAGTRYSINDLNLEGFNVNLNGQTFPARLDFVFLNDGISAPVAMGLSSDITFNQSAGTLNLGEINFNLTPMLLQGQIAIAGLNDTLTYEASVETNQFALVDLFETFKPTDTGVDLPSVSSQPPVAFALTVNGNPSQVELSTLTMTVGDTQIQTNANIRFATEFEPTNISYELVSNALDLTPFMPTADAEPAESAAGIVVTVVTGDAALIPEPLPESSPEPLPGAAAAQAVDTPLPLAFLNSITLLGSISIESITAGSMVFDDIIIFTNIEDGVLDIESQPVTAFEGTIQGNMRLDARGGVGNLTSELTANQLNVATLIAAFSQLNSFTGRLDAQADYTAQGTTTGELLNSLSGPARFAITENVVDIGVIKQVFTAISALSTTGETIQQWPDAIGFQEIAGYIVLENGIAENQQVKLRMDNFDVTGTGGLDLSADTFDYDLLFTVLGEPFVQTIQISPLYHDVSWTVQCSSSFQDNVAQYCRPDFNQVRQIFAQMGTNAVRRRLDEVINDQVPGQLQDTAHDLLRDILN